MSLTDVVKEVVEDFDKRKNPSEIWKTLEKRLKKAGFKNEYKRMIDGTDILEAYNLLKVLDAIDKYLKKKNNPWRSISAEMSFKVIKAISGLEDIEEVIKTLGESGYEPIIKDLFTFAYLPEESLKIFETLAKDGLYKKYDSASKSLKKLGYKGVSSYAKSKSSLDMIQLDHIINIAKIEGDVSGAIYVLVSNGYKIDEAKGLNKLDFDSIKKITEEDEKEKSEGKSEIPIYLYKKMNVELFQEYFNNLEVEKKKSVLKSILEYETKEESKEQNNPIREWIEKDYESLLREVGFED